MKKFKKFLPLMLALLLTVCSVTPAFACTGFYVGGDVQPLFETKGDNDTDVDPSQVHPSNVVGKYVRKAILGLV